MTPKKKWTDRHGRPELTVHPDIIDGPTDWRRVDEPANEASRSEPSVEQSERVAEKRRRAARMADAQDNPEGTAPTS